MDASVDLAKQAPLPGWSLRGFAPFIETDGKETWRTVIGKKAELRFIVPETDLYQIKYKYFTDVKPLKIITYLDGRQIDSTTQEIIINGYGYDIRRLSKGEHVLRFEFSNVREVTAKSQDKRPIPVAFLQLQIGVKEYPAGILGMDGFLISFIFCNLMISLAYRFFLK